MSWSISPHEGPGGCQSQKLEGNLRELLSREGVEGGDVHSLPEGAKLHCNQAVPDVIRAVDGADKWSLDLPQGASEHGKPLLYPFEQGVLKFGTSWTAENMAAILLEAREADSASGSRGVLRGRPVRSVLQRQVGGERHGHNQMSLGGGKAA